MKRLSLRERNDLVDAAMGRRPFDTLIRNVRLVNVFTGEIYRSEIGICHGYIAFVDNDPEGLLGADTARHSCHDSIDGTGLFAVPGFIDAHVHIESSMLTPPNFARLVVPRGTMTIITDPHEIANVMGIAGVEYMLRAGGGLPMYQYVLAPSCVPAVPSLESSGAHFGKNEIGKLLDLDGVLGVAEVMDYYGVLHNDRRMAEILDTALDRNLFIQGHVFGRSMSELAAYLSAGPSSNHEITDGAEARISLRSGMYVDARDSSFERNVAAIVRSLDGIPAPPRLTLCTDDRVPSQILASGHIDDCLRSALAGGLDPVAAIRAATINTATAYGLRALGAIAPGYVANLNLLRSLETMEVASVFFEGTEVARDHRLLVDIPAGVHEEERRNTVQVREIGAEELSLRAPREDGTVAVRVMCHKDLSSPFTEERIEAVQVNGGYVALSGGLNYIAVIQRHGGTSLAVALIRNFHLHRGAVAATVCHDSHNLAVVYTNTADALRAVAELVRLRGGIAYVDGDRIESLALPVAGLMSLEPAEELAPALDRMNRVLHAAGIEAEHPILRIATVALPVIPSIKLTDCGLVDTVRQELVSVFA